MWTTKQPHHYSIIIECLDFNPTRMPSDSVTPSPFPSPLKGEGKQGGGGGHGMKGESDRDHRFGASHPLTNPNFLL